MGENGEEAAGSNPRNTSCWTGSSSNLSCDRDEKPPHAAVCNPR